MKSRPDYARLGRSGIAAFALGAVLMFVAVPSSRADDRANCQRRIEQAEAQLQQAIRQYGEHSQQADNRGRELNNERERCWNQQRGWWNGQEQQWHQERDWDRDHDRASHERDPYRNNPAYESGYKEGRRIGSYDRRVNRPYQPGNYKAYKNNGDAAYRSGFVAGYDEGFGRRQGSSGWGHDRDGDRGGVSNPAYQNGYNEGLRIGRYDRSTNRTYQPGEYKAYKEGDQVYRNGFVAGYDEGFGRRQGSSGWGNDRDGNRGGVSNPAYQNGYNEGLRIGRYDRSTNRTYQPGEYKAYKEGDQVYRNGFVAGYDEGFGRTR